jgi:beta-1,2-mannosidase
MILFRSTAKLSVGFKTACVPTILACASLLGSLAGASLASAAWSLGPFVRPVSSPVITPQAASIFFDPIRKAPVHWEALHTFNPAAILREGKIELLYRAEDDTGAMEIGMHTSRLGLAESEDGIHFARRDQPVFYPSHDAQESREWPGGVEDPRIVQSEKGTYVLTYTQWNHVTYTVGIAGSKDLQHWTKYGPAFGTSPGDKYSHLKYKSAGILTRREGDHLIAARVRGKYWMYWGEGDVGLATSDDLIHWKPVEQPNGSPLVLLSKRPGHFDSGLPEVGPPPLLTRNGILLIYNGKNAVEGGDAQLAPGTYAVGEAYSTPAIRQNCLPAPNNRYSSRSWRSREAVNTSPAQRLRRDWSSSREDGFCTTALPTPSWALQK